MRCEELEKLFPDYLNGDISASQKQLMDEHLSHCARCRSTLAAYEEARQHLSFLKDAPIPSDFAKATMTKVKAATTKSRSRQWLRPALGAATAVIVLAILLVTQPWGVNPQSVMAKAYAATSNLQSYRMTSSATSTFEGKTIEQTSEWEFAFPDRHHGKMTMDGETYEFIIISDKQYTREPSSTQSGTMYVIGLSSGSGPSKEETLELLDTLTDLEKLPDEKIDGVDCFHYRGRVDIDRMVDKRKAELDPAEPGYEERVEALEWQRRMKTEVELWIGKDDYLIRQMKYDMQVPSEDTGEWDTSSSMVRYYDFNEPIEIEPPVTASGELLSGWRLVSSSPKESTFSRDVAFTIGGDDPAHQQISFRIAITNISEEVASNVRVTVHTMATNEESRSVRMEAEPSAPIDLEPGESETYCITWEYDASHTSKDELARLVNLTTVLAKYTTPDGEEAVELLFPPDVLYPSKPPPKRPPG